MGTDDKAGYVGPEPAPEKKAPLAVDPGLDAATSLGMTEAERIEYENAFYAAERAGSGNLMLDALASEDPGKAVGELYDAFQPPLSKSLGGVLKLAEEELQRDIARDIAREQRATRDRYPVTIDGETKTFPTADEALSAGLTAMLKDSAVDGLSEPAKEVLARAEPNFVGGELLSVSLPGSSGTSPSRNRVDLSTLTPQQTEIVGRLARDSQPKIPYLPLGSAEGPPSGGIAGEPFRDIHRKAGEPAEFVGQLGFVIADAPFGEELLVELATPPEWSRFAVATRLEAGGWWAHAAGAGCQMEDHSLISWTRIPKRKPQ